jgi:hypothetical protein
MATEEMPVVECRSDGTLLSVEYYQEGKHHRDGDLPAVIYYADDGVTPTCVEYYCEGKRHRDGDLPAVLWYAADGATRISEVHTARTSATGTATSRR